MNTHNTTVRVFRDMEEQFERRMIWQQQVDAAHAHYNKKNEPSLDKYVSANIDTESYNKAIDDAANSIWEHRFDSNINIAFLVDKLQQLKKK